MIRLLKQSLSAMTNRQQVLVNEGTQIANACIKLLEPPTEEGQPLKYNTKVLLEITTILKSVIKPRLEEQLDVVQKYENRLIFEIKNLENKIFSSPDCEDFSTEQDPTDHHLLIRQLI